MTQKTAMQQLIDWLDSEECLLDAYSISHIKEQIEPKLLATDKEQIIEAYKYALPANMSEAQKQDEAEFYYNETYGQ